MDVSAFRRPGVAAPTAVAALLFIAGLGGTLTEAWGYGLLLVATLLLAGGVASFLIFILTRSFDTAALHGTYTWLLRLGGWGYVFGVSALSGYFCHETLNGHMEAKWILFGPAALAAVVLLDLGLYRLLVARNLPTWQRYGHLISRQQSEPAAMRRTLVDDVILHRSLFSVSGFRWFKHTLIFWGFAAMFAVEIIAVFVREGLPAFGMADIWEIADHPVRLAFDVAFDLTGLMVLVGCILALVWRVMVNGTELQKFSDTPTAVFLFIVVLSGFIVEGLRINMTGPLPTDIYSFVGLAFAGVMPAGEAAAGPYEGLWLFHVLASCAFIAYVPVKRMVHSCATPMGRLMNSQKGLLAAKKENSLRGLMAGKEPCPPHRLSTGMASVTVSANWQGSRRKDDMPALKQVLPQNCLNSLAPEVADLLDVDVVATKLTTGSPCSSHDELFEDWPGSEPHVRQWFVLANGKAVGISEAPDAARTVAVAEYAQ